MSRRRSWGRLTRQPGHWVTYNDAPMLNDPEPTTPWWFEEPMPWPWDPYLWRDWLSAWAELTHSVCESVWRKQGARIYAAHRDRQLREDLRDWLVVKAVESAADFTPDPWHPAPHLKWAKWLYNYLGPKARHHFAEVVGPADTRAGQAARNAHQTGIDSTDRLDDQFAETGRVESRHALHGETFETLDPLLVLLRIEELAERVEDIERNDYREPALHAPRRPGDVCYINGCNNPVFATGLCKRDYERERLRKASNCIEDNCLNPVQARERCSRHYELFREAEIEKGTWGIKPPPAACVEDDCEEEAKVKARCLPHYREFRKQSAPPCSEDGCERPAHSQGLCGMHYQRRKRARDGGGR